MPPLIAVPVGMAVRLDSLKLAVPELAEGL